MVWPRGKCAPVKHSKVVFSELFHWWNIQKYAFFLQNMYFFVLYNKQKINQILNVTS